jgi:hypothetical protein
MLLTYIQRIAYNFLPDYKITIDIFVTQLEVHSRTLYFFPRIQKNSRG